MAFRYPTSFREAACERMLSGEHPEELAEELEVSAATLYRWKAGTDRCWLYAFKWGERVRILGGDGRLGQVTPPAWSNTRSR
jgi:hypothetical protein